MAQSEMRASTAAICLLIAAAGCTTTDDPHTGGFVSGVTNLANGGYDRRLTAKRTELGDLQDVNRQLNARHAEIEAQRSSVRAERDALTVQLTELDKRSAVAQQRLESARRSKRVAEATLTSLIAEQKAIESEIVPLVQRAQLRGDIVPAAYGDQTDAPVPSPEDIAAIDVDRQKAADLAERQQKVDRIMDEVLAPAHKP